MTAKEYNKGVRLWADDAMRFAMRCCPSRPDCEDAVQEALASLWSHRDEVPQAKGKSYLLSAAYRSHESIANCRCLSMPTTSRL